MMRSRNILSDRFFALFYDYHSCAHGLLRTNTHIPGARAITARRIETSRSFIAYAPNRHEQKESASIPNHYTLFPNTLPAGPPPKGPFAINTRQLRSEFLQLQSKAHPDMHADAGDKRRAEGLSALINEAYKTLQDPLLRAQYLLSLRGMGDVAADETAKVDDPELLGEVLEVREAIEAATEEVELEPLKRRNEERMRASVEVLEAAFATDDLEAAKEEAVRLRYWVNIKQSLDGWERGKPVVLVH